MHTLKIPRETKKTCAIILLSALLAVAVGSCAGMTILHSDAAAAEREAVVAAEREDPSTSLRSAQNDKERETELPKELLAVEEAYTPAAIPEPPAQTVSINGQECGLAPASETIGAKYLGTFKVTHYAPCVECCGKSDGISASGRPVKPYYSVAVDPTVIPLGTIFFLDYGDGVWHEVRADDTGSAVKGNVIDLCVSDYETAVQMGVRSATVYRWNAQER